MGRRPGKEPPQSYPGRRELGLAGEEAAAAYLVAAGYVIKERNFRCRLGEIDMVAYHNGTVVFIEVRTRTGSAFGLPEESVDWRKKAKLKQLAAFYLLKEGLAEVDCRFDVVSVRAGPGGTALKIELFANAFD